MNFLEIENKKQSLLKKLSLPVNGRIKVIFISKYYDLLFNELTSNEIIPFLLEFIDEYTLLISKYDPEGLEFSISEKLYGVLERVLAFTGSIGGEIYDQRMLRQTAESLNLKINNIKNITNGKVVPGHCNSFCFPLLDNNPLHKNIISGILETCTVRIYSADTQKFIIIPSEKEIENNLQGQIENSWKAAIKLLPKFTRRKPGLFHVIIQFDKRMGFYHGNSLGVALTLNFLQAVLNFYNCPFIIGPSGNIAFSGGMLPDGDILPTSDNLIGQKVEMVFFTGINLLVTAKENEKKAHEKLLELKEKYPDRELGIIGIADSEDLLNRRNIVEIKKQNPVGRSIKYVRKNPVILALSFILLAAFFAYSSIIWDTNPDNYSMKGDILFIKNKIGQTLWTQKMVFSNSGERTNLYNKCCRIVDINDDGINEVIIALALEENRLQESSGNVTCYNNKQEVVWSYLFRDSVATATTDHSRYYSSQIIDTVSINNQKFLYLTAVNVPLYPNAIYRVKLQTGEREGSEFVLWHSGGITDAIIGDFNEDGKREIAAAGANNGFEVAVFFTIDLEEINNSQLPSTEYYTFRGLKKANYNEYILLAQTDYSYYYKNRYNIARFINFNKNNKQFEVWVDENIFDGEDPANIIYFFSSGLKLKMIDCGDDFSFNRDDLIRKGKLNPPFTNTAEFFSSLKKEVKYLKPG